MPKSATSLLQENLFPHHPDIEYVGKFTLAKYSGRKIPPEMQRLLRNPPESDVQECRDCLRENFDRARESGNRLLFSIESLTGGPREQRLRQSRLLADVLVPDKIVITLRHPLRFIESMYFQKLRGSARVVNGYTGNYQQKLGMAPTYFGIEQFLQASDQLPGRGMFAHLDLARTADMYAAVVGEENVGFFFQEQLAQEPLEFIRDLCTFLGIRHEGIQSLLQGKRKNDRMTQIQVRRLKLISKLRFLHPVYRGVSLRRRRKIIEKGSDGAPARAEIPEQWRERILEEALHNNRILKARWNIPLEQYGYPF